MTVWKQDCWSPERTSKSTATRRNGCPTPAVSAFRGLEADRILVALPTVAASAGAACHSDQVEVSHVLAAMKVPMKYAMGTIRFSVGRFTTAEEIDRAVAEVCEVVNLATAS